MLLIGDVHGQVNKYHNLLRQRGFPESIQVGDFGFANEHRWHLLTLESKRHKVLFGNHDDTAFLSSPHSLGDFYYESKRRLMAIRGAFSIDKAMRIEGRDWWADEEMSYAKWWSVIEAYETYRPEIVVSHDCPHEVRKQLFGINDNSLTSNGLQSCFEAHQPRLWVFGHHHRARNEAINGTRFICLEELKTFDL